MRRTHVGAIGIAFGLMGTSSFAADFSSYRGLQFGMSMSDAAKQLGTKAGEARVVHQHPAVIQEMDWGVPLSVGQDPLKTDPLKELLLCFLDGQLFRIVATYDRYRIEGMTADDMVKAISLTYGTPTRPAAEISYHSIYGETAPVLARWEDAGYSYNLVRSGDRSSFAMILSSKRLDALAQTAIAEAVRLETEEAPQRELEKQKKKDAEERSVLEKARSVNVPNFLP